MLVERRKPVNVGVPDHKRDYDVSHKFLVSKGKRKSSSEDTWQSCRSCAAQKLSDWLIETGKRPSRGSQELARGEDGYGERQGGRMHIT